MAEKLKVPKAEWKVDRWGTHTKRLGRVGYLSVQWVTREETTGERVEGWEIVVLSCRIVQMHQNLDEALEAADKWATRLLNEAIATI